GAHFVFLGSRHYRLRRGAAADLLEPQPESGLGILRAGRGGTPQPNALRGALRRVARDVDPLVITKANALATVHRSTHLDYVAVKEFDRRGTPVGEHRFLGLWTSTAYFASPRDIPLLRRKAAGVVAHFGLDPTSHDGKAVLAVLETFPRDELFQSSVADLVDIVRTVVNLYGRRTTRLIARRDPFGRFWSCMVYVPRDRYTTDVRQRIEQILLQRFAGTHIESQVQISDSNHARLHVVVRMAAEHAHDPVDLPAVEQAIAAAATTWSDRLRAALLAAREASEAMRLAERYAGAFPVAYQSEVDPADALEDVASLESLRDEPEALRLNLHRPPGQVMTRVHLKIVRRGEPVPISDLLPVMENFGLRVISERPWQLTLAGGAASVQDFELETRSGATVAIERIEQRFTEALLAVWRNEIENDGFNRLLLPTADGARDRGAARRLPLPAADEHTVQPGLHGARARGAAGFAAELLRLFAISSTRRPAPDGTRAARADLHRAAARAARAGRERRRRPHPAPSSGWCARCCAPASTSGTRPAHAGGAFKLDRAAARAATARPLRSSCRSPRVGACTAHGQRPPAAASAGPTGARTSPRCSFPSKTRTSRTR
ncbi:MAG: NAD-glutamate dehydrogenase, partial [Steroidobacteraceae bacterium]